MDQKIATTKDTLHALIDALPQEMWGEAERYLTGLTTDDSVLRRFLLAPLDDEPLTEKEIALIEEGEAEMARGETMPWEEVEARLFPPD